MRLIGIFIIFILILNSVFAEEDGFQKIQDYIIKVLRRLITFAFSLILFISGGILIFLGIKYFFAKENVKELHTTLLYVILGIILLFVALFIPNLLRNFLESIGKD